MGENTGNGRIGVASGRSPADSRTPAAEVRGLVRRALTASLATVDRATGYPYASLVLVGCASDGSPVLLLSQLARHTRNLHADPRASLLFDGTLGSADPLAGGRATLIGRIVPCSEDAVRRRFLSRHPDAAGYAGFQDFGFYAMTVERAHFIGGFGRVVELSAGDVLVDTSGAQKLLDAEPDLLAELNAHHAGVVATLATGTDEPSTGAWQMTGVDPDGADLRAGRQTVRLTFETAIATPDDARSALIDFAGAVRGASRTCKEGLT